MRTVARRLRIALVGALVLGVVAAAVLVSTGRFELGRHGSSAVDLMSAAGAAPRRANAAPRPAGQREARPLAVCRQGLAGVWWRRRTAE